MQEQHITAESKRRLREEIVKVKFGIESANIHSEYRKLGEAVYKSIPGIDQIKSLPQEWFAPKMRIKIQIGSDRFELPLQSSRPMPHYVINKGVVLEIEGDLGKKFQSLYQTDQGIRKRISEFDNKLKLEFLHIRSERQLLARYPGIIGIPDGCCVRVIDIEAINKLVIEGKL